MNDELSYEEGWGIFEADGSEMNREGTCPIQLQRLDEEGILEDDQAAHILVVSGAKEGKAHHLAVLRRLREEAKPELAVVYWSYLGEPEHEFPACLSVTDDELDAMERFIFTKVVTRNVTSPSALEA